MEIKCSTQTIVAGPKIVKTVVFDGETHVLTLHMATYSYPTTSEERIEKVTNDKGKEVVGIWKYGKKEQGTYVDPIKFDGNLQLMTVAQWASGNLGDEGNKYLIGIVEKHP